MTNTASNLESLIRITIDSAEGYERAAETAKTEQLKQLLREQSKKRHSTVAELNEELVRIGGQAQERGSATGAAHNVWTRIADAFADGDEAATERVEEGEDYIENKFREALENQDWDPRTREVLQRAHSQIAEGERLTDRLEEQYD
ncbi:ferritin-like domain-containing protein [Microvirga roseola]|uniref:ferritin-like domain-containing protein n=1 Tax=Microvirga roseola TaxID=2883126 RepID=UPI001E463BF7|nr:PA2169 family four-helix-bundle protein [Microvirga roseola]